MVAAARTRYGHHQLFVEALAEAVGAGGDAPGGPFGRLRRNVYWVGQLFVGLAVGQQDHALQARTGDVAQRVGAIPPAAMKVRIAPARMPAIAVRSGAPSLSGTADHSRSTRLSNCTRETASVGRSMPMTYSAQRRASASGRLAIEPDRSMTRAIAWAGR